MEQTLAWNPLILQEPGTQPQELLPLEQPQAERLPYHGFQFGKSLIPTSGDILPLLKFAVDINILISIHNIAYHTVLLHFYFAGGRSGDSFTISWGEFFSKVIFSISTVRPGTGFFP